MNDEQRLGTQKFARWLADSRPEVEQAAAAGNPHAIRLRDAVDAYLDLDPDSFVGRPDAMEEMMRAGLAYIESKMTPEELADSYKPGWGEESD
jgi:hypothetical protein